MPGEKARSARHVERPRWRKRCDVVLEFGEILFPAGPVAPGETAHPEIPVVVFGRAVVVVLLHHFSSWHRVLIDLGAWTARRGSCLDRSPSAMTASGRRIRTRSSTR